MREILFRGKRTDNGEWIYGDLMQNVDCIKIREQEKDVKHIAKSFEIDLETVGQYTDLTDKNGKRIFEGDILKVFGYNYVIMWDSIRAMFYLRDPVYRVTSDFYNYCGSDLSVIGNIYDNPELLGGENNGINR